MNMKFLNVELDKTLSLYIKSVMVFESDQTAHRTSLPFFADGFPGLLYHDTPNGLCVNPLKKEMPPLFLYGQTIEPIEIEIFGKYQMIVFQLYPFTLKSLFNVAARSINDDCYDLSNDAIAVEQDLITELSRQDDVYLRISLIASYFKKLIVARKAEFDEAIFISIKRILAAKGNCSLAETAKGIHLTKRTFERRFLAETGLTPKQFAKIIQFQNSLTQISINDYRVLTDVVYQNGFADQSHFIRVFKSFTGKTPRQFVLANSRN